MGGELRKYRREIADGSLKTRGNGEETPLLAGDGSVEPSRPNSVEEEAEESEEVYLIGTLRGTFMILSILPLVFQLASNVAIITTTQSKIAEDLDASSNIPWLTSVYMITLASTSPLAGKLAEVFSPKSCVLVGASLFSIGGVLSSQATVLRTFLLGRAVSGLGGAGIMVTSFTLVLNYTSKKRRGLYFGLLNSALTTGVSLGAVLAGALLPIIGWRFIFLAQGPLSLLAGIAIFFSIPSAPKKATDTPTMSKLAKIDYLGAVTLASSIICFLVGFSTPAISWIPIIISPSLLALFFFTEIYLAPDPILPVTVLKSRGLLFSCLAQLGIMMPRFFVTLYAPVYAIAVRGWSPASAGAILVPTNLGFAVGGLMTGGLHIRRAGSFWLASVISYVLFVCTLVIFAYLSVPTTHTSLYIILMFANGLFTGAGMNYSLAHVLHLTPASTHVISTSLVTTFRSFAGSFGSSVGGGGFVRKLKNDLEHSFELNGGLEGREALIRKIIGSPAMIKELEGVEQLVAVGSYVAALRWLFFSGAALGLATIFVQAASGWNGPKVADDVEEVENGRGFEDEEWEEGMVGGQ